MFFVNSIPLATAKATRIEEKLPGPLFISIENYFLGDVITH